MAHKPALAFETRQATPHDAAAMALAHVDSIESIGAKFYPPDIVDHWKAGLTGEVYVRAMAGGETFFVATGEIEGASGVLGFASDYAIEGPLHGTSVYVRGAAARRGIGSALVRLAEDHAVAQGATSIQVEASLAGVDFYARQGFVEFGRGETRLMSGQPIGCVYMRKIVAGTARRTVRPRRG